MMIKIIRNKDTYVYECNRYSISAPDEDRAWDSIIMESDNGNSITVQLTGPNCKVYAMNNDGKTIDTYWFSG